MSDEIQTPDRLHLLLETLERIPRRFAGIATPTDFTADDAGIDRMDAICLTLVTVGEQLKKIDRETDGRLLSRYPGVRWRGAMAFSDMLAQSYFQLNTEQLFAVCRDDVPTLIETLKTMIADLERGAT